MKGRPAWVALGTAASFHLADKRSQGENCLWLPDSYRVPLQGYKVYCESLVCRESQKHCLHIVSSLLRPATSKLICHVIFVPHHWLPHPSPNHPLISISFLSAQARPCSTCHCPSCPKKNKQIKYSSPPFPPFSIKRDWGKEIGKMTHNWWSWVSGCGSYYTIAYFWKFPK